MDWEMEMKHISAHEGMKAESCENQLLGIADMAALLIYGHT